MPPGCPSNGPVSVGSSLLFVILNGSASVARPECSVQFMRCALCERTVRQEPSGTNPRYTAKYS